MKSKKYKNIKKKIIKIAHERFIAEGLSRVLIECIRNNEGLKIYDIETMALVLHNQILRFKEDVNYIHRMMDI